jgi:uncharacterized phage-associated protein
MFSHDAKYSALHIAKYIIKKSQDNNDDKLTNLKLQKLLYYAQGWYLGNFHKKLFSDKIQAWRRGPAVKGVYSEYKNYGATLIDEKIPEEEVSDIDQDTREFLDELLDKYKKFSGTELAYFTHNEPPWVEARKYYDEQENSEVEISADSMESYFRSLVDEPKNKD